MKTNSRSNRGVGRDQATVSPPITGGTSVGECERVIHQLVFVRRYRRQMPAFGARSAAALAACAQQPPVMPGASRQAALEPSRKMVARHRMPAAHKAEQQAVASNGGATYGLASFYSYDPHTASGEKFDKRELTAAHRTLPF